MKSLPEDDRRTNQLERLRQRLRKALLWGFSMTLIGGVFFLGLFLTKTERFQSLFKSPESIKKQEIFGFAPYWTLSKIGKVDWKSLTTFAYFSLPVNADGSIPRDSYEWSVFKSDKLKKLMAEAGDNHVKKVVTLTQMEASVIEQFLDDRNAWDRLSADSVEILKTYGLDGVNIDFEYIPSNNYLKGKFSEFVKSYTENLNSQLKDPYITVSVLASSVRFNRIYDISALTQMTDGVFMMAYDFYYPGSEMIGPSAPLYGFDNGWHVVYLEDERSLAHKLDYANKKNLGGVGIWALGYEDGFQLWSMLKSQMYN